MKHRPTWSHQGPRAQGSADQPKVVLYPPSGPRLDLTKYPAIVRLKRHAATMAALIISLAIWALLGFGIWQHLTE